MKVVAHRCAYCDGAIENSCITALGRTWHHDHFFCSQCGCAFPDGQFMEKDGKVWGRGGFSDIPAMGQNPQVWCRARSGLFALGLLHSEHASFENHH